MFVLTPELGLKLSVRMGLPCRSQEVQGLYNIYLSALIVLLSLLTFAFHNSCIRYICEMDKSFVYLRNLSNILDYI